jgi:DNA-directed RNA polymerase specialized sigma24 family protein
MTVPKSPPWADAIASHDRSVFLSVLALGLAPDRAREVTQAAWTRLLERDSEQPLDRVELPGLAIRQARFIALNDLHRGKTEKRVLAAVPDPPAEPAIDRVVASRQEIDRVLDALATCSPTAKRIFHIVYATPGGSAATAAREVGLSLQRVRQILCETRAHIRRTMEGGTR